MADSTTSKLPCSQFNCPYPPQMMLHGGGSCCETVRQIHDGMPGHSVCPCQFDRVLQHRVSSVPVNVLPRPPFTDAAFTMGSGTGLSAFYSPLARACDLKDSTQPWRDSWYLAQASRTPFELHGFDPHTHAACTRFAERFSPIDLAAAGARRKNATRETTSTLKAWLYEHRKNPYPTKGEKIMLAILTKMTLTQVSTWFANARRRLKKENKMTWSPRNRCGERKDGTDGSDCEDDERDMDINSEDEENVPIKLEDEQIEIQEVESKEEEKEFKEELEHEKSTRGSVSSVGTDSNGKLSPKIVNPPVAVTTSSQNLSLARSVPATVLVVSSSSAPVEDSPVKSLRRWVDGCFHNSTAPTGYMVESASPVACETPPSTPPQRNSTEIPVITSAPSSNPVPKPERRQSDEEKRTKVPSRSEVRVDGEQKIRSVLTSAETRSTETTNYREIDAALALTTLSSR